MRDIHYPPSEMNEPPPQEQEAAPLTRADLSSLLTRPHRIVELVLGQPRRLAASVWREHRLPGLALLLLLGSVVLSLPFGAVLDPDRSWRIAVLLVGSLGICFPSLHIFSAFFGSRLSLAQNLCAALVITCVAALFTFGFFPVLWFVEATMSGGSRLVTSGDVAVLLLITALTAGLIHLGRVLHGSPGLRALGVAPVTVLICWLGLFMFISHRMAGVLELL